MAARFKTVLLILATVFLSAGCVEQKQKGDGCSEAQDQGLEITFLSRSRCQDASVWPDEIGDIRLMVFDGEGVLAYQDVVTGADDRTVVTVPTDPGLYTVIGWAGADDGHFDLAAPVVGVTHKTDIVLSIRREWDIAESIDGVRLFTGESDAVYVEAASQGDPYIPVSVNLLEVTNRLTVSVEGLPTDPEDYTVTIEADNGSMACNGDIVDDQVLTFQPSLTYGDASLEGEFTLLKLETGHIYYISIINTVSGTELYHGSLLGTLILKNPEVDLLCDHDFTIRFTVGDQCNCGTYAIGDIYVNDWLVHSYETEL